MYPIPPHEHLIETRTCKHCQTPFPITDKDMEFYAKVSPKFGEKTYMIPPPTLCPDCRRRRRMAWRNVGNLYRRTCDATGKKILAFYDESVKHPIYEVEFWNSDGWNPLVYGREFNFQRSFFEQFGELKDVVPHFSRSILRSENSEYSNNAS